MVLLDKSETLIDVNGKRASKAATLNKLLQPLKHESQLQTLNKEDDGDDDDDDDVDVGESLMDLERCGPSWMGKDGGFGFQGAASEGSFPPKRR